MALCKCVIVYSNNGRFSLGIIPLGNPLKSHDDLLSLQTNVQTLTFRHSLPDILVLTIKLRMVHPAIDHDSPGIPSVCVYLLNCT